VIKRRFSPKPCQVLKFLPSLVLGPFPLFPVPKLSKNPTGSPKSALVSGSVACRTSEAFVSISGLEILAGDAVYSVTNFYIFISTKLDRVHSGVLKSGRVRNQGPGGKRRFCT